MRLAIGAALLIIPVTSAAQQSQPTLPTFGCTAPETRQFDFWAGTWNVVNPAGQTVGQNTIEIVEGGCALQENWKGARGSTGRSLNFFERGEWHQLWIPNIANGVLHLRGGLRAGAMIMTGTSPGPQGTTVHNRISWTPLPNGDVRQLWETSADGSTWQTAFDGRYVRQK